MRAAPPALYPATLDLSGSQVVVLGAGAVALRKLKGLPKGLGRALVVAPEVSPALRAWARPRPWVRILRRGFEPRDLKGCRLLFCCSDDETVNSLAARRARAAGVWVCQSSRPEQGDLRVPAVARAGGLRMTLSTGGASPAMAKALRSHFESLLRASDLAWFLRRLEALRPAMKSDPQFKARLLRRLIVPEVLSRVLARRSPAGRRGLQALLKP
ncbi:MAG TPA: NAD(P)-dependent oxidoreductase [bacterium]|jgi:precorrin-2 dehydrogenase/sirohydrochlorin ferrochelatase|nr:NAD(P)-dependent oxidoreductase [bacterium]